jgi:hypothetical protein
MHAPGEMALSAFSAVFPFGEKCALVYSSRPELPLSIIFPMLFMCGFVSLVMFCLRSLFISTFSHFGRRHQFLFFVHLGICSCWLSAPILCHMSLAVSG